MKCGESDDRWCANPERVERKTLMFNPFRAGGIQRNIFFPEFAFGAIHVQSSGIRSFGNHSS